MKTTIQLEEIAMFGLGIYVFDTLSYFWWFFLTLFLVPYIGMIGYIINSKFDALSYNTFHHKGLAIIISGIGIYISNEPLQFSGIILFAHSAFDRILGYSLKYEKGFKCTHLGEVKKKN